MKNCRIWFRWMLWTIIAVWPSVYGAIMTDATAQARRLQRRRVMIPQKQPQKANTDVTRSVGEDVIKVALRVSAQAQNQMVDLVFVIDGSRDMMKKITKVNKQLVDVAGIFEEKMIDYRFAQTSFQRIDGGPQLDIQTFNSDLVGIQEWFRKLRLLLKNAAPGYGLDAIMQTLRETDFRPEASKQLLVVSRSRLQTNWAVEKAQDKIVKEIVDRCRQDNIQINIIGTSERIHVQLTGGTGGKLYPIAENSRPPGVKYFKPGDLDKSILNIKGVFKLTAQHIAGTVRHVADIIFVFDSSLSMETKVDKICGGIDEMVSVLDTAGLDYRFGAIRFWAATGGGESVTLLTKPPLNANQVKQLFRLPKRGDEHLLDAVIVGVPKLQTPVDRELVLIIVTDEPTSHRTEQGYTVEKAIGVCRKAGAQVNVIGGSSMGSNRFSSNSASANFQKRVTEVTNGAYYIMPCSVIADERH